jgi:hypothetical protein
MYLRRVRFGQLDLELTPDHGQRYRSSKANGLLQRLHEQWWDIRILPISGYL